MRAVRTRFGAVIGALVVCVLVLSGCAAGKKAPTSEETPAIDGTNASIGSLLLREVAIAAPTDGPSYAQGANANLQLVIVNNGTTADSLTGVTTSAAGSVSVAPMSASASASPSASDSSPTSSASASSSSSAPSSPTSCAFSSAPASSAPPAPANLPAQLCPGSSVSFGVGAGPNVLVLNGLTAQLFPAAVVAITFQFQNAGSVTVQVPVQLTQNASPGGQIVTAGLSSGSSATE